MHLLTAAVVASALSESVLAISPERPLGRVWRRQHTHGNDAPKGAPGPGAWANMVPKGMEGFFPKGLDGGLPPMPKGGFEALMAKDANGSATGWRNMIPKGMEGLVTKDMQDRIQKSWDTMLAKGPFGGKGPPGWMPSNHSHTPSNYTTPRKFFDNRNRLPSWHFINETTPGATPDGSQGIYLEPDLVPGTVGKDGATITKVRLGPHIVPSGQMAGSPVPPFQPPCKDCYVTAMQLNLEYEDGSIANVDTGAWCHHIDLTVQGTDVTCPTNLESILSMQNPSMGGERIFSNGNERVPIRWNSKQKYGLYFGNSTWFGGVMEFMNENINPIKVYLTMTFEWVPGTTKGYRTAKMVWLDVTDCNFSSDFTALEGSYEKRSKEFVMPFNADLLVSVAHQHDGGVKMELFNNGRLSCTSRQLYGNRRGGFVEPSNGQVIPHMVMPPYSHISDTGHCKDFDSFNKGDKLNIVAYFDENEHQQMRHAGGRGLDEQMAIFYTYVGLRDSKMVQ